MVCGFLSKGNGNIWISLKTIHGKNTLVQMFWIMLLKFSGKFDIYNYSWYVAQITLAIEKKDLPSQHKRYEVPFGCVFENLIL